MTPETRNLRPFLFLFAGMIIWWFAPAAFRRAVYEGVYEFQAPSFALSSRMSELGLYWEMRSRSKDELIRNVRDSSRLSATLQYEVEQNAALREENLRLEKLLGLPTRPDYRTVPARVAQRRMGMWWQQIVLRRGEEDGVRVGCPVVTSSGVIGRVRDVFWDSCVVELVSSPSFRISAKIAGLEDFAVTYQGLGASPFGNATGVVPDIPAGTQLPTSAERVDIVTSGMGGIFPAGLKIGTVAGTLSQSRSGVFLQSPVELSQDLADIEEAAILVPLNPDVLETPTSPTP